MATPLDDGHRAEETGADLVVAAGGDGTTARVARALAKSTVPMAILPLGTANNIAASLGIVGEPEQLIAGWQNGQARPLDLGLGTGPFGERRVVESIGGGLVTHGIVVMDRCKSAEGPSGGEIARALRVYREMLPSVAPFSWKLRIDGRAVEGDFLLVEVLNTPRIGPQFELARGVRPDDGLLSVVMADASHRQAIADYLEARLNGGAPVLDLPVQTAVEVEIVHGDRLHLDDEVVGEAISDNEGITVTMQPSVVQVWRPVA